MSRLFERSWPLLAFAVVNLAVAAPVGAGWDDDLCAAPDGGAVLCCTSCIFFCDCTLV